MSDNSIDHIFNQAMERVENKNSPVKDAYGSMGPLSSDHFLLKKSWVYFNGRIKDIENRWNDVLKAKDDQLTALKKETDTLRQTIQSLEENVQTLTQLRDATVGSQIHELLEHKKGQTGLIESWEQERHRLQEHCLVADAKLGSAREELERRTRIYRVREEELTKEIDHLKKKLLEPHEQAEKTQQEALDIVRGKDELIHQLDQKIERFELDLDRRNMVIAELDEEKKTMDAEIKKLSSDIAVLQVHLLERAREIENLKKKLEILEHENNSLKSERAKEQAEWRELWDRARTLWEEQKKQS